MFISIYEYKSVYRTAFLLIFILLKGFHTQTGVIYPIR